MDEELKNFFFRGNAAGTPAERRKAALGTGAPGAPGRFRAVPLHARTVLMTPRSAAGPPDPHRTSRAVANAARPNGGGGCGSPHPS